MNNLRGNAPLLDKANERSWFESLSSPESIKRYSDEELMVIKSHEEKFEAEFLMSNPKATTEDLQKALEEYYLSIGMLDGQSQVDGNITKKDEEIESPLYFPPVKKTKDDKKKLWVAGGLAAGIGALAYTQNSDHSNSSKESGSSTQESQEDDSNQGQQKESKNANGACAICKLDQCLVDLEIEDLNSGVHYYLKDKDVLDGDKNLRLPEQLIFSSLSGTSGKSDLKIKYTVSGECACGGGEPIEEFSCISSAFGEFYQANAEDFQVSKTKVSNGPKTIEKAYSKDLEGYIQREKCEGKAENDSSKEPSDINTTKMEFISKEEFLASQENKSEDDSYKDFQGFMRSIDFLVSGELNYFPANLYELSVYTCDGCGGKVLPRNAVNLYLLPHYEVSLKGALSFTLSKSKNPGNKGTNNKEEDKGGEGKDAKVKLKISYEEIIATDTVKADIDFELIRKNIGGKKSDKAPAKDTSPEDDKADVWDDMTGVDGFMAKILGLVYSLDKLDVFKGGNSAQKAMYDRLQPPLFRFELLWPKLEVEAKAKLIVKQGQLHIDRKRAEKKDNPNIGESKPISESGTINTPYAGVAPLTTDTETNRQEEETKIAQEASYIRFNPLIGGLISVNLIGAITRIPVVGPVVGAVSALFDFDMFSKFEAEQLKFDDIKGRKARLDREKSKIFSAKGFLFATADLTFSPAFYLHNADIDKEGTTLRFDGSFGIGLAAGAFVGANVYVFQASAQIQTSFGARLHFSFNYTEEQVRIWHDGISFTSGEEVVGGVNREMKDRGNKTNNSKWGIGGGASVSSSSTEGDSLSGKVSTTLGSKGNRIAGEVEFVSFNPEQDFIYPPTSYEKPSWTYTFGDHISNEVIMVLSGEMLKLLQNRITQFYEVDLLVWRDKPNVHRLFDLRDDYIYKALKSSFEEGLSKVPTDEELNKGDIDRIIDAVVTILQDYNNTMAEIAVSKEQVGFEMHPHGTREEKRRYREFSKDGVTAMMFFMSIQEVLNILQSQGKVSGFWGWSKDELWEG